MRYIDEVYENPIYFQFGEDSAKQSSVDDSQSDLAYLFDDGNTDKSASSRRIYFERISISQSELNMSMLATGNVPDDLRKIEKSLGECLL